jgi:hypothetical protein
MILVKSCHMTQLAVDPVFRTFAAERWTIRRTSQRAPEQHADPAIKALDYFDKSTCHRGGGEPPRDTVGAGQTQRLANKPEAGNIAANAVHVLNYLFPTRYWAS